MGALATIAANRSGDDPETFMRLMNEVFFNHLDPAYRSDANIPPNKFNGGAQYILGTDGLREDFNDGDPSQISRHIWFFVNAGYYSGREKANLGLAYNELFGNDPSQADMDSGTWAITIGQQLREGSLKPSQIRWREDLSATCP